ncbi:unnamed protein product [Lampetra fluviatilis]
MPLRGRQGLMNHVPYLAMLVDVSRIDAADVPRYLQQQQQLQLLLQQQQRRQHRRTKLGSLYLTTCS